MNIDEKIKDCEFYLKQIIRFNPDPFFVGYFFKAYLESVIDGYNEIFNEANVDFGLFISGKCTLEEFERKATEKNDKKALKFVSWFKDSYETVHTSPVPSFIKNTIYFIKKNNHLPKISIKIGTAKIYTGDFLQKIQVGLIEGKIRSKEELQLEIKRQTPLFLEIINQKRKNNDEPKVSANQVIASTFLDMKDYDDIQISRACEMYLPVLKRLFEESRNKIKTLTTWA